MARPPDAGRFAAFASADGLVAAVQGLRALGARHLDTLSPHPVYEVEDALELPRPRVPVAGLVAGALGGGGIYLLQWWLNVRVYPLDVGGRPLHSALAFIPWTFETTVLCAGIATFVAFFAACGLPRLLHPALGTAAGRRASSDRYVLLLDRRDPLVEDPRVEEVLRWAGALEVGTYGDAT